MIVTEAQELASDLREVIGRLLRRLRAERREFSLAEAAVLSRLYRGGPSTVSDLATAERVRPQSMAATVGQLVERRWVARTPDPQDGRRITITMTDEGREALLADRARREGWLADAIERDLTERDREVLAQAVALLNRMVDE
jgi:DNA-binding MarR family transcriptional regulator